MTIDPYPLHWPGHSPRTWHPERHPKFQSSIAQGEREIHRELTLMGARSIVITSNAYRNRDGTISSRQHPIEDTGVAVYFTVGSDARVICCDRWERLEHNLRAIALMVGAIRGIERWGGRQMVDLAFAGMTALPAGGDSWDVVLGVSVGAGRAEIDAAYKRLVKTAHPDTGGDPEHFHTIQRAYQEATR